MSVFESLDQDVQEEIRDEIRLAIENLPDEIIEEINDYAQNNGLTIFEALDELLNLGEEALDLQ